MDAKQALQWMQTHKHLPDMRERFMAEFPDASEMDYGRTLRSVLAAQTRQAAQ